MKPRMQYADQRGQQHHVAEGAAPHCQRSRQRRGTGAARAADVTLKEKRPLVLCIRETPLNKIHLRNMYRAADAGATIFPLIPAYYYRPAVLDDLARELAYRVLAHIGLPQPHAFQWKG